MGNKAYAGRPLMVIKLIGSWAAAVISAMAGIIFISYGWIWSGVSALIFAALLLPLRPWRQLVEAVLRGRLRIIAAVIMAMLSFALMPVPEDTASAPAAYPVISIAEETAVESAAVHTPVPAAEPTDETAAEPAADSVQEESIPCDYVLNTNTHKFHYSHCSSVEDMKKQNTQLFTGTRDEVTGMGYSPCGRCKP